MTKEEPARLASDPFSPAEELANSITHGLGFVLSLIGAVGLAAAVPWEHDLERTVGCLVYAASLVAVYAMSTLSHCFTRPDLRRLFRSLDQGCIYLLIVGSYTPFSVAFLPTNGWRWFLFVMWGLAIVGFVSKVLASHRVDTASVWLYVILGWMPIVSSAALVEGSSVDVVFWIVIGGVMYSLGTVFWMFDGKVLHFHAIWHLFVIAGSACHFFAVLFFVALP